MKRKLSVLLAALMVFALAGQAAAFFDDLNLIRSIYTTSGAVEVGSDLGGGVNTFSLTNPLNAILGSAVGLSTFDGGLATLVVGYWAHNQSLQDFYATGNYMDGDGLTMSSRKQSGADTTFNATQTLYADSSSNTTLVNPKTTLNSYFNKFDVNGNGIGSMGNNLTADSFEMTISLASLATDGYVDQYLYFFDYNSSQSNKAGVEVAVIRTFLTSDGRTIDKNGNLIATVINPQVVPVPAAVWLLGTGIVALVGIRRRNS
jgi:hypothetical protein